MIWHSLCFNLSSRVLSSSEEFFALFASHSLLKVTNPKLQKKTYIIGLLLCHYAAYWNLCWDKLNTLFAHFFLYFWGCYNSFTGSFRNLQLLCLRTGHYVHVTLCWSYLWSVLLPTKPSFCWVYGRYNKVTLVNT